LLACLGRRACYNQILIATHLEAGDSKRAITSARVRSRRLWHCALERAADLEDDSGGGRAPALLLRLGPRIACEHNSAPGHGVMEQIHQRTKVIGHLDVVSVELSRVLARAIGEFLWN